MFDYEAVKTNVRTAILGRSGLRSTLKAYKPPETAKIIGLRDPVLVKDPSTLTTTKFDTTTYYDRAVVTLTNSTGSTVTSHGFSIRGKPVVQYGGDAGYISEHSDYQDIEENGENSYELSNAFIFSSGQCEYIADYIWKELKPHKVYTVSLVGTQYQFAKGYVWHLEVTNESSGSTSENELIDVDVEILDVTMQKRIGGIGETLLDVRVPSGAWTKTLSKSARRVSAGNPNALNNRGNVLTVASSTWRGQADYYCDGTDDEIQIQMAIDALVGGGKCILTEGQFVLGDTIDLGDNIELAGAGGGTVVSATGLTERGHGVIDVCMYFDLYDKTGCYLHDFVIDGMDDDICPGSFSDHYTGIYLENTALTDSCLIENIEIKNLLSSRSVVGILCGTGYFGWNVARKCIIHDCETTTGYVLGFEAIDRTESNYTYNLTGISYAWGFENCYLCHTNRVGTLSASSTTKYLTSYASSTNNATYACADTSNGGFNS